MFARLTFGVTAAVVGIILAGATPASALNVPHSTVVSADPANWTPHMTDGTVYKFAAAGNRVYAGGSFTSLRNANSSQVLNRPYLVAMNRDTGQIDTGFNAVLNGPFEALATAPDGLSIYVGGRFTKANGVSALRIVRLNAVTGGIWPG